MLRHTKNQSTEYGYEKNLSTQEKNEKQGTRLQKENVHQERKKRP